MCPVVISTLEEPVPMGTIFNSIGPSLEAFLLLFLLRGYGFCLPFNSNQNGPFQGVLLGGKGLEFLNIYIEEEQCLPEEEKEEQRKEGEEEEIT